MTPSQAIAFVEKHGAVLESSSGPVPSVAQAITGSKIKGSWWAHPRGKDIFAVTRAVRSCDKILVCRLIAGKVTFVHQRLWPALVRCAERFRPEQISQLIEEHTASGKHALKAVPFPDWVSADIAAQANSLGEDEAWAQLESAGIVNAAPK